MAELSRGRVLVVDDEVELMTVLVEMLCSQNFEAVGYSRGQDALSALRERDFDILLSDLMMPQMDGIALLRAALELDPNLVGIIATGQGTVETAVEAMKVGALDYVLKPFRLAALLPVLNRGMEIRRLRLENLALRDAVGIYELGQAVAYSLDAQTILEKVADSVVQQCQADLVSIMLPVPGKAELQVAVARGDGHLQLVGTRTPIDQGVAGWVAQHQQPVYLGAGMSDPPFTFDLQRDDIHYSVSYPLLSRGKLIGVLNAARTKEQRPMRLGEIKALGILASIAAPALENANLYGEIRKAERKYRGIFENAVLGVFQAAPDGRLIAANPALAHILGYASEQELLAEVTDPGTDIYLYPDLRRAFLDDVARASEPRTIELQVRRRGGDLVWISETTRSVRDANGLLMSYEGCVQNISDRKEAEAAREALRESEKRLRQSQKMQAIGNLTGGVAHDFNNLLTVIIGFSELVADSLPQDSPVAPWVQEISRAGETASQLTRQLLAFSRKQELEPELVDLNAVVSELHQMLRRIIGADIELVLSASPDPCWVNVDPGQIQQVVLNLAVNARDAMPDGGRLTLETSIATIDDTYIAWPESSNQVASLTGQYAVIAVSDNGCGMDAETQARIFEPFFTTKPAGKGTGLGLSTVFGIVKQSGGEIWLYSEPGLGTTFKVYLPLAADAADLATQPRTNEDATHGTETILLVDDESGIGELSRAVLEAKGYTVFVASSGDEALAIASERGQEMSLLVTDLVLPGIRGRRLAEELTSRKPDLKVIFMSGYTDDVVVRHGLIENMGAYLQKPFTPATLAQKVRSVLDTQ